LPNRCALPARTRSVSVTPQRLGARAPLDLLDPTVPLLIFAVSGALLGTDAMLSPGPMWVMSPHTQKLTMSEPVEDLGEFDVPYGWEGWSLHRLRLYRGDAIQLADGPCHRAQGRERPPLELPPPVRGDRKSA